MTRNSNNNQSSLNKFSKIFSKLDFLGHEFTFESEDSNRHKTIQGALFSSVTFIAAFIMAIFIGQEIYQRKNPSVASSQEYLDFSEVYLKDFPVMYNFYDAYAQEIPNIHRYLDFKVYLFTIHNNTSLITGLFNYTLVDCNDKLEYFSEDNKNYVKDLLTTTNNNYLCIDFDDSMKFQNSFGTNNSTYVQVIMSICKEGSRESCDLSDNYIYNYSVNLAITFVDSYVDSNQYSNPVVKYVNRIVQPLSYGLHKLSNFKVKNNEFISDDGWLLESLRVIKFKEFEQLSVDMYLMNGDTKYMNVQNFESPTLRFKTNRSYIKVQDLFARVGGIANALFIFISVATSDYLRFKYLLFIRENSFNMMDKDFIDTKKKITSILHKNSKMHYSQNSLLNFSKTNIPKTNLLNNNNISRNSPNVISISQFNKNTNNNSSNNRMNNNSEIRNNHKYNNEYDNKREDKQIPVSSNNNIINRNSNKEARLNDYNTNNKALQTIQIENLNDLNSINNNMIVNKDYNNDNIVNPSIKTRKNSINKFKQEIANIIIGDSTKEFGSNEKITYSKYFKYQFCSCLTNKETAIKYEFEFDRVKRLLDIKTFKHFIMESYCIHYNNPLSDMDKEININYFYNNNK